MRKNKIKSFRLFEAELNSGLTPEQVEFLDKFTKGTLTKWTYDPATGLVDVEGDFDCSQEDIEDIKGIKFGKVSGDFYFQINSIVSLAGAPQEVGGNFDCGYNFLKSLKGAPQEVGGDFGCNNNFLISLEGSPQKVGGDFTCHENKGKLTSLAGAPQEVGGNFTCHRNSLTSLVGSPLVEVGGNFRCDGNKLTNLIGAPQKVGGDFDCNNNSLISLEGAPRKVGGNFDCNNNSLISLEGAPRKVGGNFYCQKNPLTSLVGFPEEIGGYFYCDQFTLRFNGEWSLGVFLKTMKVGSYEQKSFISKAFNSPEFINNQIEVLNNEITENPSKMAMKFKEVWKDPDFMEIRDQLKIPDNIMGGIEFLGDLGSLGF